MTQAARQHSLANSETGDHSTETPEAMHNGATIPPSSTRVNGRPVGLQQISVETATEQGLFAVTVMLHCSTII